MNPGLGIVTRLAAILTSLLLLAPLPAMAQAPTPVPAPPAGMVPPGAILVQAFGYDGLAWSQVGVMAIRARRMPAVSVLDAFRRSTPHPLDAFERTDEYQQRVNRLARYNTECSHGLMHTPEWVALMVEEQAWFDDLQRRRYAR